MSGTWLQPDRRGAGPIATGSLSDTICLDVSSALCAR